MSSMPASLLTAALFTRMSTRPYSSSARLNTSSTCSGDEISALTPIASPPSSRTDAAATSARSSRKSTHTTLAPSRASVRAISPPMFGPLPVTTATLPSNSIAASCASQSALGALPSAGRILPPARAVRRSVLASRRNHAKRKSRRSTPDDHRHARTPERTAGPVRLQGRAPRQQGRLPALGRHPGREAEARGGQPRRHGAGRRRHGHAVPLAAPVPAHALGEAGQARRGVLPRQQRPHRQDRRDVPGPVPGRCRAPAAPRRARGRRPRRGRPLRERPRLHRHHDQPRPVGGARQRHAAARRRVLVPALRAYGAVRRAGDDPLGVVQERPGVLHGPLHHGGEHPDRLAVRLHRIRGLPQPEDLHVPRAAVPSRTR